MTATSDSWMTIEPLRRDANGIPKLGVPDLERLAEWFVGSIAPEVLQRPTVTPLDRVVHWLTERGVTIREESLGRTAEGHRRLGCFFPETRTILIDPWAQEIGERYRFTLAHEVAHLLLHRRVKRAAGVFDEDGGMRDSTRTITTNRVEASNKRSVIEWQANRFAAAMLVPRATVREALVAAQASLGIVKRLGAIWIDSQPTVQADFRMTTQRLQHVYVVSASVIRIRLDELGLIIGGKHGSMAYRIGEIAPGWFDEMMLE